MKIRNRNSLFKYPGKKTRSGSQANASFSPMKK